MTRAILDQKAMAVLTDYATADEPNLVPENIKEGVTIFGVTGDYVPPTYSITTVLTNVTADAGNATEMLEKEVKVLSFSTSGYYALPSTVTVVGATSEWNQTEGTLTLSNPTTDITVTITAVDETPIYNITRNLTGVSESAATASITQIRADETLEFTYTCNSGSPDYCAMPDSITVVGATGVWTKNNVDSGTLTLSNATGNVTITITAVDVTPVSTIVTQLEGVSADENNPSQLKLGQSADLIFYALGTRSFSGTTYDFIVTCNGASYTQNAGETEITVTLSNPVQATITLNVTATVHEENYDDGDGDDIGNL